MWRLGGTWGRREASTDCFPPGGGAAPRSVLRPTGRQRIEMVRSAGSYPTGSDEQHDPSQRATSARDLNRSAGNFSPTGESIRVIQAPSNVKQVFSDMDRMPGPRSSWILFCPFPASGLVPLTPPSAHMAGPYLHGRKNCLPPTPARRAHVVTGSARHCAGLASGGSRPAARSPIDDSNLGMEAGQCPSDPIRSPK